MAKVKRYKCPYCEFRADRENLIYHVGEEHEDMIPQGYTARRVVFNMINHKEHGKCVICAKNTDWIEDAGHYDRYCSDKCRNKARSNYLKNVVRVKGTTNLMEDPEFQKKLLAGRKISGNYKFKDGGVRSYTGSYEKNLLEMADKLLNIESKYIMTPGPTLEYSYNGETHKWIVDQYWEPWNLLIEVKDGGTNPNKRDMKEYRTKQLCKEVMITDLGEFNYLRLTNNQFPQLLEILMEIKKQNMDGEVTPIIKIYEHAPLLEMTHHINKRVEKDPRDQHGVYFISYSFHSYVDDESIEGFGLSTDLIPNKILTVKEGKLVTEPVSFLNDRKVTVYKYLGETDIKSIITTDDVHDTYLYEALTGKKMFIREQALLDVDNFALVDPIKYSITKECYTATMYEEFNEAKDTRFYFPMMESNDIYYAELLTNGYGVTIMEDIDGYFVYNEEMKQRSKSYKSITDIPKEAVYQIAKTDIRESIYYDSGDLLLH